MEKQVFQDEKSVNSGHRTSFGKAPYGYRWNKDKARLEVEPVEAGIYHWIVRMYVQQGMAFRDIAIKLRAHGVRCKKNHWSKEAVGYVLKNPAYYGHYIVNQYKYANRSEGSGSKRIKRRRPTFEHLRYPIPPIISKANWDAIQKKIELNKSQARQTNKRGDFFLRGILQCGRCGAPVKPRVGSRRKDGSAPRYYACYWAGTSRKNIEAEPNRTKCRLPFLKARVVENAVWSEIITVFSTDSEITLNKLFDPEKHESKIAALQERISRLKQDLEKKIRTRIHLFTFMDAENRDNPELRKKFQLNRGEILELESNIESAKLEIDHIQRLKEQEAAARTLLTRNEDFLRHLRKTIENLSLADRKLLVEGMVDGDVVVKDRKGPETYGSSGLAVNFKLRWNQALLQQFIDECKVDSLVKSRNQTTL